MWWHYVVCCVLGFFSAVMLDWALKKRKYKKPAFIRDRAYIEKYKNRNSVWY